MKGFDLPTCVLTLINIMGISCSFYVIEVCYIMFGIENEGYSDNFIAGPNKKFLHYSLCGKIVYSVFVFHDILFVNRRAVLIFNIFKEI